MSEVSSDASGLYDAWVEFETAAVEAEKAARAGQRRQWVEDSVELVGDYVAAAEEHPLKVGLPAAIGGAATLFMCGLTNYGDNQSAAVSGGIAAYSFWASWMMYKKVRYDDI
ncbi:MAG: hypothetical protein JWM37_816 [Candidatus Saccharibacteria bacterium]|nr:hypothetical protein [Candidatus Saccharibacteria bacterium]